MGERDLHIRARCANCLEVVVVFGGARRGILLVHYRERRALDDDTYVNIGQKCCNVRVKGGCPFPLEDGAWNDTTVLVYPESSNGFDLIDIPDYHPDKVLLNTYETTITGLENLSCTA